MPLDLAKKYYTVGNLKNYLKKLKKSNRNIALSLPLDLPKWLGGSGSSAAFNIPLFNNQKEYIEPTRIGFNVNDKKAVFIESNLELLYEFYHEYQRSKEFKLNQAYAETIPLKYGDEGFEFGENLKDYKIHKTFDFQLPDNLVEHQKKAIELFQKIGKLRKTESSGEWENNTSLRIAKWDRTNKIIHVQQASYFDQVSTNLTLDWASGYIKDNAANTIRNTIEGFADHKLPKLEESILANTLGVAVVLVNREDDEVLVPIRGNQQAIMNSGHGQFHCSASGVFEWYPEQFESKEISPEILMEGMKKEIQSEIGLNSELYKLIPLAFTRELARGGKPQLFFVAETKNKISELKELMSEAVESWEFIEPSKLPANSELNKYIDNPLAAPKELFTYEGNMAFSIAASYLYKHDGPFVMI